MENIFFFGKFRWNWWWFTQYPKDETRIFRKLWKRSTHREQFLIYRDGNLLYYAYVRKFGLNQKLGIGVVTDKVYSGFANSFKDIIELMASQHVIVKKTKRGRTDLTGKSFKKSRVDIDILIRDELTRHIQNTFGTGDNTIPPAINISKQDIVECRLAERDADWIVRKVHEGYHNFVITNITIK